MHIRRHRRQMVQKGREKGEKGQISQPLTGFNAVNVTT